MLQTEEKLRSAENKITDLFKYKDYLDEQLNFCKNELAETISEADDQGYIIDQILDDVWTVKYYDRTGTELLGTEFVVDGKNAEGLDEDKIPSIEGYEFKGWNLPLKNI